MKQMCLYSQWETKLDLCNQLCVVFYHEKRAVLTRKQNLVTWAVGCAHDAVIPLRNFISTFKQIF